jgi:hypothetical protein
VPVYDPALHGLRLSQALKKAAAAAPIDYAVLYAYELYHPSMAEPARIVNNMVPIEAGLEADAPRNPSEVVTFMASAIRVSRPPEGDQSDAPQINIEIDNVSSVLTQALRVARSTPAYALQPWELIERIYCSNDLTAPDQLPPMTVTLTNVSYNATTATLTASFGDPVNVSVPRETFKPEQYVGLANV